MRVWREGHVVEGWFFFGKNTCNILIFCRRIDENYYLANGFQVEVKCFSSRNNHFGLVELTTPCRKIIIKRVKYTLSYTIILRLFNYDRRHVFYVCTGRVRPQHPAAASISVQLQYIKTSLSKNIRKYTRLDSRCPVKS